MKNANARKGAAGQQGMNTKVFGHKSPDAECLKMIFLPKYFASIRRLSKLVEGFEVGWIPAGGLRPQDFPEAQGRYLTPALVKALGFLTFDCGGGENDQHTLANEDNRTSSLHLYTERLFAVASDIVARTEAGETLDTQDLDDANDVLYILEVLDPVFAVLNANDLKGTDIVPKREEGDGENIYEITLGEDGDSLLEDPDAEVDVLPPADALGGDLAAIIAAQMTGKQRRYEISETDTPHTRWNLRTFLLGLNAMYPSNPEIVLEQAMVCFASIWLSAKAEHGRRKALNAVQTLEGAEKEGSFDARRLFKMDVIFDSLSQALVSLHPELEGDAAGITSAMNDFLISVGAAMQRWESEWTDGVEALFDPDTQRDVITLYPQIEPVAKPGKDGQPGIMPAPKRPRQINVVTAETRSLRFGPVARRGNVPRVHWYDDADGKRCSEVVGPRPYEDRPELEKASVVMQWQGDHKVVVSTAERIRLDRVALVWRYVDLVLSGVRITPEIVMKLKLPGNFSYLSEEGWWVHVLYFTNYREGLGNGFRANPDHPPCRLTRQMGRELLLRTLSTSFEVDPMRIAVDYLPRAWKLYKGSKQEQRSARSEVRAGEKSRQAARRRGEEAASANPDPNFTGKRSRRRRNGRRSGSGAPQSTR